MVISHGFQVRELQNIKCKLQCSRKLTISLYLVHFDIFQGAFQAWIKPDGNAAEAGDGKWRGIPMPGGHFGPVKDLSWSPSGDYLLTASCDQV